MILAILLTMETLLDPAPRAPAPVGEIRLAMAARPVEGDVPVGPFSASGPVISPSIGMGLNGLADWTTEWPFLDVFRTAREWSGEDGGWGADAPAQIRAVQDEQGWLTRMPEGMSHVSAILLTSLPAAMTSAAGTYRLTYEGKGSITLHGATNIRETPGQILFDYQPDGKRHLSVDLTAIDPADHLRNIAVVHERHTALYDAGQVFNPQWLAKIADLRVLRFMDWMRTNDSPLVEWQDRAQVDDYTWTTAAGVPVEVMVDLANRTGSEPWFTLPHQANDDYTRALATYVRDHLDPRLRPWFEYSNEVWNWQFGQAHWANEQGRAAWPEVPSAWLQIYAGRSVAMARVIDEVYGPDVDQRVHKVISTQTGWQGLEIDVLTAPDWQKLDGAGKAPHEYFNTYAITGYFGGTLGQDEKAPEVKDWLEQSLTQAHQQADAEALTGEARDTFIARHRHDRAIELAEQELRDGSVTGDDAGSLAQLFATFAYHKRVADRYGLQLAMYEGGTHVSGVGPWAEDAALTAFFLDLNYSPAMGRLYEELLQGWKDRGGTLFNAFVDIAGPSRFGSWGNLRHIDDQSPRWDALMRFNRQTPAWWDGARSNAYLGNMLVR